MNDRSPGRNHSYFEASTVAINMIKENGLHPQSFYDEIPVSGKKSYMLNYKGISLLAGLMGCSITSIEETNESDEKEIVVKVEAQNPNGDKGFSWLSRPKHKGKSEHEDDWREKIYTHGKRNALRDLVPYGIFLEMLLRLAHVGAQPEQQPKQQQKAAPKQTRSPLDVAVDNARDIAIEEKENLINLHDITVKDVISFAEEKFGKEQSKWDLPSQWIMFAKMLQDPVNNGVPTAYSEEEQKEEESEALEAPEANSQGSLFDVEKLVEGSSKSTEDDELAEISADLGE